DCSSRTNVSAAQRRQFVECPRGESPLTYMPAVAGELVLGTRRKRNTIQRDSESTSALLTLDPVLLATAGVGGRRWVYGPNYPAHPRRLPHPSAPLKIPRTRNLGLVIGVAGPKIVAVPGKLCRGDGFVTVAAGDELMNSDPA